MRLPLAFLLGGCLLAASLAQAAPPVELGMRADQTRYDLLHHSAVWRTPSAALGIADVSAAGAQDRFQANTEDTLYFGYAPDTLWLRFTVVPEPAALEQRWVLDLGNALLDEVHLYSPTAAGGWRRQSSGYDVPVRERAVPARTPAFELPLIGTQAHTFYLEIRSNGSRLVTPWLLTQPEQLRSTTYAEMASGLFYGALLIMLAYNFFLYLSLRDANYLIYCASILFSGLFQASLSGHGMWALWPQAPQLSDPASVVALIGTIGFGCWFGIRFLDLQRCFPLGRRLMLVVISAIFVIVPMYYAMGYGPAIRLGAFISMVAGPVALLVGVVAMLRGAPSARFYVIAWTGYNIGAAFAASRQLGLVPNNFLTAHGWQLGTMLEAVLLSFALSDRYNQLRREKEAAQQRVADELRRLDALKDEFLANTSHELRTPLQGIIGLSESMLDGAGGKLAEGARHNLQMIVSSGQRLARLVDDILDFSRLKTHELRVEPRAVDLRVATEVVITMLRPLLGNRPVALHNRIDPELPAALADETRLQQVLTNLVGNAVKFTDEGEITVQAELRDGQLLISVTDTGIGISPADQERIFGSFEQVDGGATRSRGGTGLGLTITRQLIVLQGGDITVNSEPGVGSTFRFSLPVATDRPDSQAPERLRARQAEDEPAGEAAPAEIGVAAPASEADRVRILVVDDEPVNQQVLKNHLSLAHFEVVPAMDGAAALSLIEAGHAFDLVLLDVMMPRMSGYEVCERIRRSRLPTQLPVIMVTAKNQVADLVAGLDAGANDYLGKPFSKQELLARIKTHLNLLKINSAYGHFVPQEFLRHLNRDSIIDVRLGDSVEITTGVFISDIRGFTTLSESMSPADNFAFINAYFARMAPVIREHGGFISRYTGDAIMGLFPSGAEAATRAAIASIERLEGYNLERVDKGRECLRIGIGLHCGSTRLGVVGEVQRRQGEVFSDAINLASRIEELTKRYATPVILSADALAGQSGGVSGLSTRWLDRITVRGRSQRLDIYELLDPLPDAALRAASREAFEAAVQAQLDGRTEQARELLRQVLATNPADRPAQALLERLRAAA